MTDILARVQKLIALSASPNKHEARNAAYQACKLIREHNLRLTQQGLVKITYASDIGGDLNLVPWDARRWGICPSCRYSCPLIFNQDGWMCMSCARGKAVHDRG